MQQRACPPNYKAPAKYAWMDGEIIPYDDAKIHVRAIVIQHGANVFEGIKAYWNQKEEELYILKLSEHMDRLFQSMKMTRMAIPFSKDELCEASIELLAENEFKEDVHFRPTSYVGLGDTYTVDPDAVYMGHFITAVPRPAPASLKTGYHCCISSWERISDRVMPPRIKAAGNYLNSRLAALQAKVDGYDYPILLNHEGRVTEGPAACLLMVRNGKVISPSITSNILESITRKTLLQLVRAELGIETVEREVDRTELYIADEIFFCGTRREVTPVVSVDRIAVGDGNPGPLTLKIQDMYFDIARGKVPKYKSWLTPVYGRKR
ncbi:branched-chain amino acid transaminase [Chloroflexota bacterium]